MKKQTLITVKTNFNALHCWKGCPHEEVAFLRFPHRHVFWVRLEIEVFHDDRELEFFLVKKRLDDAIKELYGDENIKDLGSRSCEMINDEIFERLFKDKWITISNRKISITTSEDDENSATTHY